MLRVQLRTRGGQPLGLLVLTLLVLYIIYGPKMFVAFLYAGI